MHLSFRRIYWRDGPGLGRVLVLGVGVDLCLGLGLGLLRRGVFWMWEMLYLGMWFLLLLLGMIGWLRGRCRES